MTSSLPVQVEALTIERAYVLRDRYELKIKVAQTTIDDAQTRLADINATIADLEAKGPMATRVGVRPTGAVHAVIDGSCEVVAPQRALLDMREA